MDSKVGAGSRKRNISMVRQSENHHRIDTEKDDADEEMKMKKFFDLIERIRDSRERLLSRNAWMAEKEQEKEKKRTEINNKGIKVWVPRFQLEDFAQDHAAGALMNSRKPTERQETKQTHSLNLDLNLSL